MRSNPVRKSKLTCMRKLIPIVLLTILLTPVKTQDAKQILQKTREAFGGSAWDTINYVRMHYIGHQQWLEQSENPSGPFITSYIDVEELRDTRKLRMNQKVETKMFQSIQPSQLTYVQDDTVGYMAFGERKMSLYPSFREENIKWMQYAPENVLKQALTSNIKFDKMIDLDGVNHYQVSFAANKIGYTLFINANTFLISEAHIDTYAPNEFFFSVWGKFKTRIQYSVYALHQHNVLYPLQWDVYRTGQLWKRIIVNDIAFQKTADESALSIPDDIRKSSVPAQDVNKTKLPVDKVIEVAKGIFVIPGNWFTGWAEQEDGIVVIESPISSGYSVQLISEIRKRYPSKKIKAVVVSSDAWPHLAGVREYISVGVPVYTNKLNKPILDKVATADFSPRPDNQQTKKLKPVYSLVDKTVSLDDKNVPIQILPVNGEGGERMVAVYFPKQKVLYASDLIQQQRDKSFFFIEYLAEVKAVVDRNKLQVDTVYAMHTAPLAWKEILEALEKNK